MRPRRQHFGMTDEDHEGRGEGPGRGRGRGPRPGGHDGPPWGGHRMRRGDIRTAVLSALQAGPGHGYELMGRMSEFTGGRWRPSPGSVYPTLQALQDEGLVTSSETDGKRVFALTEAGVAEATLRAETRGRAWMALPSADNDALRSSVMQLIAAAKQVGMNGSPELLAKAEAVVTEARRKLYQLLAEA